MLEISVISTVRYITKETKDAARIQKMLPVFKLATEWLHQKGTFVLIHVHLPHPPSSRYAACSAIHASAVSPFRAVTPVSGLVVETGAAKEL